MAVVSNKQVLLRNFVETTPTVSDMELKLSPTGVPLTVQAGSGAILVKNLYLSCDPYMRGRMRDFHGSYIAPFTPGSAIEGFGVSRVIDSDNPDFAAGDLVTGITGWEEYSVIVKCQQMRKIQNHDGIPLSYHLGLLGMTGFTAYCGFFEVCAPKKGDFVFVSAASGAVGQLVGQLAKSFGCYVVGSAGTTEKVNLLKTKLGFDEAFNYKEEADFNAALKRYFPDGIDIYFDNVGGAMLEAAILNMKIFGRIAVCGMLSQNGQNDPNGIHSLFNLISRRIRLQGFIQSDYLHLYPQFLDYAIKEYTQGTITYIEDMNYGLENAAEALVGLFSGKNVGKQVICVSRD